MNLQKLCFNLFFITVLTSVITDVMAYDSLISTQQPVTKETKFNKPQKGMLNHFDQRLNKTTFLWANKRLAKPSLSPVAFEQRLNVASDDYLQQLTGMSSIKNNTSRAILTHRYAMKRGAKVAKFKQKYAGIEVFNREYNILMDDNYDLISASGYLADNASSELTSQLVNNQSQAFGASNDAIFSAFTDIGGDISSLAISFTHKKGDYDIYQVDTTAPKGLQLLGSPRAKPVLFDKDGDLVAAHYVEIQISEFDVINSFYFGYVIDAVNKKVLFKKSLTSHAQDFNYRIYADNDGKPWDSPHGNVIPAPEGTELDSYQTAPYIPAPLITLAHSSISTLDPWLPDDATTTEGNNVISYVDLFAPQGLTAGDFTAETTSDLTFDYQYDDTQSATTENNRKAAIVSLFALNNYLHDDFYDHGFNEQSGNAQTSNYGRGGEEGDPILAEVQDYSGTNNANMSTPADGESPRMQMFLWNNSTPENGVNFGITVTSDASIGLIASSAPSTFGPSAFDLIESTLVRYEDNLSPIHDACTSAINSSELSGKIVIIDRGDCDFTEKVINAQTAGAIGVIIANNRDGDVVVVLGGSDTNNVIQIPNMSISENDGATIYAAMAQGTVTISMFNANNSEFKDSAFDHGIVAHEWGHYITNRLIGNSSGLNNNQGSALGEGWGDFHALLLLSEESDALLAGNELYQTSYSATSYIASFVTGIRRYPYSTNMDINPLTFKDIETSPQIHDSGEVWASMLWDSYVALINDDRYTFEQAQSVMKDYLVASYKMTPLSPTYTEARDALLSVALANEEADYDLILAAFARRGMGIGAISPDRNSDTHQGVVESFATTDETDEEAELPPEPAIITISTIESTVKENTAVNISVSTENFDNDALIYNWTQTSGPAIILSGTNTSRLSFTTPSTDENETLIFSVLVSDGSNTLEQLFTRHIVTNVAPEITTSSPTVLAINENETATLSVTAIDLDGDELIYSWTQTAGTQVALTNENTPAISFTAPNVSSDQTLLFQIDVSDGDDSVTQQFTVNVNNIEEEPATNTNNESDDSSESSSSGGSMHLLTFILIPLCLLRRKKYFNANSRF